MTFRGGRETDGLISFDQRQASSALSRSGARCRLVAFPLAGQAQTGAAASQTPSRAQEEARQLIRQVAESLRAKEAADEPAGPPKNWKPARTPWGDPDLSGVFTNSDESGIPFEKPAEFEGRRLEDMTAAELAEDSAGAARPDARPVRSDCRTIRTRSCSGGRR